MVVFTEDLIGQGIMMINKKYFFLTFALIFSVFASDLSAVSDEAPSAGNTEADADTPESAYENMELLTEALLNIKKSYVEEKTYEQIIYGAMHGMLYELDPYSNFLEPAQYSDMQDDTRGEYSGIGIHIGIRDGLLTVIAPIEGTPAFKAGLQPGDRIVEINGEESGGVSLREAVSKLRGKKGTEVVLSVQREGVADEIEVKIVREDIQVVSVRGTRMLNDKIGYTRIVKFDDKTMIWLREAMDQLKTDGMEALVLDLRGNPGGLLSSAVDVGEMFLKKGDVVVSVKGRPGVYDEVIQRVRRSNGYADAPMVVLVNKGSASAAEIVAGALQDNERAVLVGDTTFGKGSVQTIIRSQINNKTGIRLTTAYYYTPKGRLIHKSGLTPDIPIKVTIQEWEKIVMQRMRIEEPDAFSEEQKQEYADVTDPQLDKAVEVLKGMLIFSEDAG